MKERSEDSTRAIEASRSGMCLSSNLFDVKARNGKWYKARIMRRAGRDFTFVYASSPSLEMGIDPSSTDIDRVREWEAY